MWHTKINFLHITIFLYSVFTLHIFSMFTLFIVVLERKKLLIHLLLTCTTEVLSNFLLYAIFPEDFPMADSVNFKVSFQ